MMQFNQPIPAQVTRRRSLLAVGTLCAALMPAAAIAQGAYPNKPIRVVVPYTPGGAPDILGRLIGQKLGSALGQQIVVDNKPGAGGNIGADAVARSAPDGYTLLMTTTATQSINQSLYPNMPYDGLKDFSPVSLVAYTPVMLVSGNALPANNLKELIAYAQANPGKLSYASAGQGTVQHISGVMFANLAKLDMVHVPYKGTGQITPDLIAGRVSLMFNSVAGVIPFVREKKLKAFGVSGKSRSLAAPEVPTIAEAGLPGFDASAWYAVYGPAGMPMDITQRLNGEINKIVASADMRERYTGLGLDPGTSTPAELGALTREDAAKWAKVIKDNRISLQ
jgi:tripartite-type tricarboxylate transporter receptor subunit TctC